MPDISEMNQELVKVFNINLCYNNIAVTNLTVQNLRNKDHIIVSFDENMKSKQCIKYLNTLKEKIIKRSYKAEKAADVSYNLKSFPFNFDKGQLDKYDKGRKRFLVEIDEGVVFNLKCYLAKALARDIKENIGKKFGVKYAAEHMYDTSFDKDSYLYCMLFRDKALQMYFINSFLSKIERYENAPASSEDYLRVDGSYVYIKKSIFDNIEFIKDIEAHNASLICRDFQTPSSKNKVVENLKFPIVDFIRRMNIPVRSMFRTSYRGSDEDSILVPIVYQTPIVDQDEVRFLDRNDVSKINSAFDMEILSDVGESISARLQRSNSSDGIVYGIDFSDLDISCCVMNTIMENSVINKNYELSIDPELHFRALSPFDGKGGGLPDSSLDETGTQQYSPRSSSEAGKLFPL